ncbi:MAG: sigma-54-dependent Fis family transcriptional regulator [Myxococcales bacterium]|nr:sigma-54-dependent Fis family transcriptional regulator [Myxococcales bacterium]
MRRARVLVVDDEPSTVDVVRAHLEADLAEVASAGEGAGALAAARAAQVEGRPFDVVLLDFHLPHASGREVARDLAAAGVDARIVIMSGRDAVPVAVEAMRMGAFDFIAKPLSRIDLRARIERAFRDRGGGREAGAGARRPRKSDVIIGAGPWLTQLYERLGMVAPTDVTVTIAGESGTGKELVARTIHSLSPRFERPFVVVSCAALPESLLEDELFGHVRGAFTDANRERDGLLASADGGTLFLDEVGELPLSVQAKLLRVLQFREYRRLGDDRDRQVDIRIIAATHRDLTAMVAAGTFREDLMYRINVFPLELPPLRDRAGDIPLLAQHFVLLHRARVDKRVDGITAGALARMCAEPWPGNVRQLENKIQEAMVVADGPLITEADLDLGRVPAGAAVDLTRPFQDLKRDVIDRFERSYLRALIDAHAGNLAAAARQAGMDRKNLWLLLRKHALAPGRGKH